MRTEIFGSREKMYPAEDSAAITAGSGGAEAIMK